MHISTCMHYHCSSPSTHHANSLVVLTITTPRRDSSSSDWLFIVITRLAYRQITKCACPVLVLLHGLLGGLYTV